jgi:hypothetical protein
MRSRLRAGVAAGVGGMLLAGLAGCSALLGAAATPAVSASAAPAPSYTVSVVNVATPKPRTAAPTLTTTGSAWPAILASLSAYGQWVLANPDPALVGNVATPGCSMYDLTSQQTTALLEEQAYLKPSAPVFSLVTGPSPTAGSTTAVLGNQVTLSVTASHSAEPVVSRKKSIQIAEFGALAPTRLLITLFRGTDNKWRFCTVTASADTGAADDPTIPLL